MPGTVKRRPYESSRRAAAAAKTRSDVVAAARQLFSERGFDRTTLREVADCADVSLATVKALFSNKAGLVWAVRDVSLAGDGEPIPLEERDWYLAILAEHDPDAKLRAHAEAIAAIHSRAGKIHRIVRDAGATDEDLAALWSTEHVQRRHGMELVVRSMVAQATLRDGLDVEEAITTMWVLSSPETYWLLTDVAGWSGARYAAWLHHAMVSTLSSH
ncbi:MAG: hypothetical protein NVS3B21_11110 [Acidimicrobiales bacterium]